MPTWTTVCVFEFLSQFASTGNKASDVKLNYFKKNNLDSEFRIGLPIEEKKLQTKSKGKLERNFPVFKRSTYILFNGQR